MKGVAASHVAFDVSRIESRAARLAVGVGVTLMVVKFIAYLLTESSAIFSDAMESIVNVIASGFGLYAVRLTHRPPDAEHPWGHGKVEFLAGLFEGALILLAGGAILFHAAAALWDPPAPARLDAGLVLIAIAMLVNGLIGWHLLRTGRRHHSMTLEADGKHLIADAITSAAIIVALFVVGLTGLRWIDPLIALLVGAWLLGVGVGLVRRGSAGLMDEQDVADDRSIRAILEAHLGRGVCGYHKLRHRHTGRFHWIDFHLTVPPLTDVKKAHDLASAIEGEIERSFAEADATAHIEPCEDKGCPHCGRGGSSS
jgi:cation diffusion facilitator family transporter